jgi:hypothetical protein
VTDTPAPAPQGVTMTVVQALQLIERWIAERREYQMASAVKACTEYVQHLEKRLSELEPAKAEAEGEPAPTVN